jgi:hypothetical protein
MFNVYITATFFTLEDKVDENPIMTRENNEPLDAEQAMRLAKECSERVSVGYVRVVDIADDATVFEWHFKLGVLFPPV